MTVLDELRGPLSSLDADGRAALAARGRQRTFARNQSLVVQGAQDHHVHILLAGHTKVTRVTSDGHELLLGFRGPGEVVGELAAIDGRPRSASVVALERVAALELARNRFIGFLTARPRLHLALTRSLVARLRDSDHRSVDLATRPVATRLGRRLLRLVADHGRRTSDGIAIDLGLTHAELAASIGASREAVSHALARLRQEEVVTTGRRTVTIVDVAGLRRIAEWDD